MTTALAAYAYEIWSQHGLYACVTADGHVIRDIASEPVVLDVDYDEVQRCIDEDGWCGTYIDVEPVVVVPFDEDVVELPDEANAYLDQPRD